ncbi:MAG: decarboxylating NADP(+)-dependent phosphogluconate dehydrogenase, partial [Bryobacteraceae bacterium]|nr:decarboxylating NADP(+)-dependent phosphogluconate dehydrogenase [Bryobacteraceae bacterium]
FIILVKAGKPTDAVIEQIAPLLEQGDIIIDGGNANWNDTIRRERELKARGLRFIGSGVSGGEEGARFGPAMMPGGDPEAYKESEAIWNAVAAKGDADTGNPLTGAEPGKPIVGGVPCSTYIGPDGAGHYVKMVHNGIEYGDMQMICEAYWLMKNLLGMSTPECGKVFEEWNKGLLDSFLIEITADILQQIDPVTGNPIVDMILDTAGQKGTGKWTTVSSLDLGIPVTLIGEAVYARCLSALKDERVEAAKLLAGPKAKLEGDRAQWVEDIRQALLASKLVSYAQGFMLMKEAAKEYGWNLNYGNIAMVWRGGCIIRSAFLGQIKEAFDRCPDLKNLLLDEYFNGVVARCQESWRRVVSQAVLNGVPVPAFTTALAFYDGYRSARLPANLLQAQRDYFGAHTYERTDRPRGEFSHTNWTGKGGNVSASTYTV